MTDAERLATRTKLPACWVIEHGYQGRWHASSSWENEAEARTLFDRQRSQLTTGQTLRLVRTETTIIRTLEATAIPEPPRG